MLDPEAHYASKEVETVPCFRCAAAPGTAHYPQCPEAVRAPTYAGTLRMRRVAPVNALTWELWFEESPAIIVSATGNKDRWALLDAQGRSDLVRDALGEAVARLTRMQTA